MENSTMRVCVAASGGGSTLQAIIAAIRAGQLTRTQIGLVVVSELNCGARKIALDNGIPVAEAHCRNFHSPCDFADHIIVQCRTYAIDFWSQNGWILKTPTDVCEYFHGRSLNQHPGPLDPGRPDFGGKGMAGLAVHAAVLAYRRAVYNPQDHDTSCWWTEATTHKVTSEYDKGAILSRCAVPIDMARENPCTLAQKVLTVEHTNVIQTLQSAASGQQLEMPRSKFEPLIQSVEALNTAKRYARRMFPEAAPWKWQSDLLPGETGREVLA